MNDLINALLKIKLFKTEIDKIDFFKNREKVTFLYAERKSLIEFLLKQNNIEIVMGERNNLGNCYNSYTYTVKCDKEISDELMQALRVAGVLGWGQSFVVRKVEKTINGYERKVIDTVDSSG